MPTTERRTVTLKGEEETVYIVDDEEPLRRSLKYLLESVKLHVEAFESAEALLKTLTPLSHGCIVLDVRMPGMSGPEMVERIRKIRPAIRVLFMSGYTADLLAQRGVVDQQVKGAGRGVEPDVEVQNQPGDVMRGKDAQLDAAIAYLKEKMAREPMAPM